MLSCIYIELGLQVIPSMCYFPAQNHVCSYSTVPRFAAYIMFSVKVEKQSFWIILCSGLSFTKTLPPPPPVFPPKSKKKMRKKERTMHHYSGRLNMTIMSFGDHISPMFTSHFGLQFDQYDQH